MKKTPIIRIDGRKDGDDKYKAHAFLGLTNLGGISIEVSDDGDAIRYQWYDNKPSKWQEIKYTKSGKPYFTVNKTKYYLDEFMRINVW